jgi:peroxiredoxin Q/BCP
LADYSGHFDDFRAAGAGLAAISADDAARTEPIRQELGLKFPLLCDTGREVINAYGLLNRGEKGGIAFPASFVIDRERVVRFRALEAVASRVSVEQLLKFVRELGRGADPQTKPRNSGVFPGLMFLRATMNALRHGVRSPNK